MNGVCGGAAAASIDASPGLPIGPGGRPVWMRVLYGEGLASSERVSAPDHLLNWKRVVASMPSGAQAVVDDRRDQWPLLRGGGLALHHRRDREHVVRREVLALRLREVHRAEA